MLEGEVHRARCAAAALRGSQRIEEAVLAVEDAAACEEIIREIGSELDRRRGDGEWHADVVSLVDALFG